MPRAPSPSDGTTATDQGRPRRGPAVTSLRWPDHAAPQHIHLDFAFDDLDEAEALLLGLGAVKPDHQPGGDRWRVFLDPAGHPFCLTRG
ncbi:VOC family protein [Streptomyces angustmyceticus]